jgi:hypothetical protein
MDNLEVVAFNAVSSITSFVMRSRLDRGIFSITKVWCSKGGVEDVDGVVREGSRIFGTLLLLLLTVLERAYNDRFDRASRDFCRRVLLLLLTVRVTDVVDVVQEEEKATDCNTCIPLTRSKTAKRILSSNVRDSDSRR